MTALEKFQMMLAHELKHHAVGTKPDLAGLTSQLTVLFEPLFVCLWCKSTAGTEDQGDGWQRCKDCGGN